jgi:hypothetical protein
MDELQRLKTLQYGFDARLFSRVKRQPIREGNLIAHVNEEIRKRFSYKIIHCVSTFPVDENRQTTQSSSHVAY